MGVWEDILSDPFYYGSPLKACGDDNLSTFVVYYGYDTIFAKQGTKPATGMQQVFMTAYFKNMIIKLL
jgi:hypothetical protein